MTAGVRPIVLFDEAAAICLAAAVPVTTERVDIALAHGRVLAAPVHARTTMPPFDRAMMDGYAIRSADQHEPGTVLRVIGEIAAGQSPVLTLQVGQAYRIMTGAPLPDGADAVVRWEWCEECGDDSVAILRAVEPGAAIQATGEDAWAGDVLLPTGRRLMATDVAVCHAFGVPDVEVARRTTVRIITTGDELVRVPQPLQPGQIYGSNDAYLAAALLEDGAIVLQREHVADHPARIAAAVTRALEEADYTLITGGISAGRHDYVPAVLADVADTVDLQNVWLRPGSPFLLARRGAHVAFGLSGNPAACSVQFESLIRPVIRRTLGVIDGGFASSGILSQPLNLKPIKHTRILRGVAHVEDGVVHVHANLGQSAGVMVSFAHANCLIRVDHPSVAAGAIVPVRWLHPV